MTIAAAGPIAAILERYRDLLPTLFIVSDVVLHASEAGTADAVQVTVDRAPGVKCERCWRYVPATRAEPAVNGLCDRCVDALAAAGDR